MEERKEDSGLLRIGTGLLKETKVIACNGCNIEVAFEADLPDDLGVCQRGKKNLVHAITIPLDEAHDAFEIEPQHGPLIRVLAKSEVIRYPAGGALNFSLDLKQMGIAPVGIIAPMGSGRNKRSLLAALRDEEEVLTAFYPGDGTSITVNVRDPRGQATLFCEKRGFSVPIEVLAELKEASPKIFGAISVKSLDLPLVGAIYDHFTDARKVLTLHEDVLERPELHTLIRMLIERTCLLQLNHHEASMLIGGDGQFDPPQDIRKVSAFGAEISVVTLGKEGAVMMERGGDPVFQKPVMVVAKDTSGSGDAHAAAMIKGIQDGLNPKVALQMAAWVAALKTSHVGPWKGVPTPQEWEAYLETIK